MAGETTTFGSMFGGGAGGGGVGGLQTFLAGPWQDITEGLGAAIAAGKGDQAWVQYMNEKNSKRKRTRFEAALAPMERVADMIAKEPRMAKMFAPGGVYDDFFPTQLPLIRAGAAGVGLDGDSIANAYEMLIGAMSQLPDEGLDPTTGMQNLATWEALYNNGQPAPPEVAAKFLGGAIDENMPKPIGTYPSADGQEMVIIWDPISQTVSSKPAGARAAPQPLVSQVFGTDAEGNFGFQGGGGVAAGGETGVATGAAGGAGGPSGGAGFIPTGKPGYSDIQGINLRVAEMDTGVTVIDGMLGIAGQPGPQLGRAGGIKGWVNEFFRVGRDLASVSPAMRAQITQLTNLADSMIQRDLSTDGIDPELASSLIMGDPTVDAKAAENRLAYMYARLLQGDGKILKDAVESARAQVSLLKGSEQTVVQNLLNLRTAFIKGRQALQKSSGLTVKPEQPKPDLGEYGGRQQAAPQQGGAPADFSKMTDAEADAAYAKLPSGARFIGPDGKVHVKP